MLFGFLHSVAIAFMELKEIIVFMVHVKFVTNIFLFSAMRTRVQCEKRAGGRWTPTEASNHINYLELLTLFLSLKALCTAYTGSHIQVQCDKTTAVCYINNMGGSKSTPCNAITKQIWALCITQNNWLSATHLPGCENVEADAESRIFNERTEWMLDPQVFMGITQKLVFLHLV